MQTRHVPFPPQISFQSCILKFHRRNHFVELHPRLLFLMSVLPVRLALSGSQACFPNLYDQTDMDFNEVDAQIVLEVARTCRTICRLEQELVEARYAESIGLVKLYKHWAEDVRKQHDYTEFDLGLTRDVVTNNFNHSELLIMRRPNTKYLRLSSPSEHQHTSKYLISTLVYTSSHQQF
jgi:hypothetical protein